MALRVKGRNQYDVKFNTNHIISVTVIATRLRRGTVVKEMKFNKQKTVQ